jgi:BlaI family transcriptional regulator, penicillinase repressor
MAGLSLEKLGPLQRDVLERLWDLGEATVHEIIDRHPQKPKPAYTTILSVMQNLEKLGWVEHRKEGRSYTYKPAVSREETGVRSIKQTINQLLNGDKRAFMQHLLDDDALCDEDYLELRKMINRKRRERKNG